MTRPLEQFIDALREELQQHGELLACLDEAPVRAASAGDAEADTSVESQAESLIAAQREREHFQFQLAWASAQPQARSFEQLIHALPSDYRPLLHALVEENEALRRRVGQRLRENLSWLDRACELSCRMLRGITIPNAGHGGCSTLSLLPEA